MNRKTYLFLALLALTGILLSGCTFIRIQNVSNSDVTVSVTTPDNGSAYTRLIREGNIVDVFSSYGGRYTVTQIPSERYKDSLKNLQSLITQRLFEEGATLTAEEVAQLTENLNNIDQLIEDLAIPGASCGGNVPDFDTVVVVVAFDETVGNYVLSCGSGQ